MRTIFAVLRYFFFKAPLFVSQMAPAAALTGSLLSLSLLSRSRELLALKACGLWSDRLPCPLLLVRSPVKCWGLAWNEFVVPSAFHKARFINSEEIKKKPFQGLFDERGFWYHGENAFYHIEHFDPRTNILSGFVYTLDGQFQVRSLIEAITGYLARRTMAMRKCQRKEISSSMPLSLDTGLRHLLTGDAGGFLPRCSRSRGVFFSTTPAIYRRSAAKRSGYNSVSG